MQRYFHGILMNLHVLDQGNVIWIKYPAFYPLATVYLGYHKDRQRHAYGDGVIMVIKSPIYVYVPVVHENMQILNGIVKCLLYRSNLIIDHQFLICLA